MPGDGFAIAPDTLTTHAGQVRSVGDDVANAKQAGNAVHVGMDAYGQLCTIVPMIVASTDCPPASIVAVSRI